MDKIYVLRGLDQYLEYEGYIMSKQFSCFKNDRKDWRIVDNESKLLVISRLPRCEDCWNWIRIPQNKEKVLERIQELKDKNIYQKYVKMFETYKSQIEAK